MSNKYGPDQALKKLIREDNTEVSLAQLQKRYGKPEDIKAKVTKKKTAAPKVTTPPAKPSRAIKKIDKEIAETKKQLKEAKAQLKALEERDPTLPTIAQLQGIPANSKIQAADVNKAFDLMEKMEGVAGENARKLRQFAEKKQVFCSWSGGKEATGGWQKQKEKMAYLLENPQLKKSLQLNKKRNLKNIKDTSPLLDPITSSPNAANTVRTNRGLHICDNALDDVNRNMNSVYLDKYFTMKGNKGAAGYTFQGSNHIVMRKETTFKAIKDLTDVRNAVKGSVASAAKNEPLHFVEQLLHKRVYSKNPYTPSKVVSKEGWLTTYVHEMGHQIHYAANRPAMKSLKVGGDQWIPSKYGGSNYMEQFAETFVQYVFDPVGLKKASPSAYKWVDDAVTTVLKISY